MLLVGARRDLGAVGGEGRTPGLLGAQDRTHQIEARYQRQTSDDPPDELDDEPDRQEQQENSGATAIG